MGADKKWLTTNLGGAPRHGSAAEAELTGTGTTASTPRALARKRIEYDGRAPAAIARADAWPEAPPTLSHYIPVQWPEGLAPKPATASPEGDSLPDADVLIVTWTMEEGNALAHVLTPGCESNPPTASHPAVPGVLYWKPYTKNFAEIAAKMRHDCPAVEKQRLGTYWTTEIGERKVTLFKSDSHFSQDGSSDLETTPNRLVWEQIISDCRPKLVITTGTGGGIGAAVEVGDVIVSRFVSFDPGGKEPNLDHFECAVDVPTGMLDTAQGLFAANAVYLPSTNSRPPRIVHGNSASSGVVTTVGFKYDDTADTYGLKGKGDLCEMGDAVLGYVCRELGADAPPYAMVRNASDPEIDSSEPDPAGLANWIYEHFGCWSTVCSAIACWGLVAGLEK